MPARSRLASTSSRRSTSRRRPRRPSRKPAVALHHAYGAIESALARVARTIDGGLPEGADWHQALLESMTLDIESVRPAVLCADSVARLRPLLAFRHFFRHAYAATWDAGRLAALRDDALAARAPLRADLQRLDEVLRVAANP